MHLLYEKLMHLNLHVTAYSKLQKSHQEVLLTSLALEGFIIKPKAGISPNNKKFRVF